MGLVPGSELLEFWSSGNDKNRSQLKLTNNICSVQISINRIKNVSSSLLNALLHHSSTPTLHAILFGRANYL
jgi:hypothetical protein